MAIKQVEVPGIGIVKLYKRRDSRSIKISLNHSNEVKVTLPSWVPYRAGLEYVKSKSEWISRHQKPAPRLGQGTQIGKSHRLYYYPAATANVTSRVTPTEIRITHPITISYLDSAVQTTAKQAGLRALKQEAQVLLPQRLEQLATKHDYTYQTVKIKNLRSRWGSCSQQKHISLSFFLMLLPWQLIDYVLLHELTHTQHLNHSPDFWNQLESRLPNSKQLRKDLRNYQPII